MPMKVLNNGYRQDETIHPSFLEPVQVNSGSGLSYCPGLTSKNVLAWTISDVVILSIVEGRKRVEVTEMDMSCFTTVTYICLSNYVNILHNQNTKINQKGNKQSLKTED